MNPRFDMILRNGCCLTPAGRVETDIGIRNGRIAALGDLALADADSEMDCRWHHILPGLIDTQVHFREPGMTHKEDLATGSRSAVAGGITTVFEMPNTKPPTTTPAALNDKLARAAGRCWSNYAFFAGASPNNLDILPHLEEMPGCAGIKMFMGSSTGELLVGDDPTIARVLGRIRRRMPVHAEDEPRLRHRRQQIPAEATPHEHARWRDPETALRATSRLLALARQARKRVQVLHITTAEEMALLAEHRDVASVEVTPQHLTFAAPEAYDRLGSRAQMNPPIRDERHRAALWEAVANGIVDVMGSDHAPHTAAEKDTQSYPDTPSGLPGVQTMLPVMLGHVQAGHLSLERLVDLLAGGPARLYNIAGKGRIAVGYDADFTICDLSREAIITSDWIATKGGWTPFEGMRVKGWPVATIVGGQPVMRDGEILGEPAGTPVRFQEVLA